MNRKRHTKQIVVIFFAILSFSIIAPALQLDVMPLLNPPEDMQDSLEQQAEYFQEQLQRWQKEVIDVPPNPYRSFMRFSTRGAAFINLVNMGAETLPFWFHVLLKDKNQPSYKHDGEFLLSPDDRRNGVEYVLRGGSWFVRPLIGKLTVRTDTSKKEDAEWFVEQWQTALRTECIGIFEERRSLFHAWLEKGALNTKEIQQVEEWWRLRGVGIPGIPLIIERIENKKADHYDYLLLKVWTMPFEMHPQNKDKPWIPKSEEMLGEVNENPEYWLQWWEENKIKYWWLFPKER